MNPSQKTNYKLSTDPIDKLIFEKGLRIHNVAVDKSLDLLLLILNNGSIIKNNISAYHLLKKAKQTDLNKWKLIGGGVGISWEKLNEDLSIKGFIKTYALDNVVRQIEKNNTTVV